jgi:hypothetical protein
MHRKDEKCIQSVGQKLEGKRPLRRTNMDRRIVLEWIFEK